MIDVERRVREDLHASADLPISDRDVDLAWRRLQVRVSAPDRRARTVAVLATAAAVLAVVAGLAWWELGRGPDTTLPGGPPAIGLDSSGDCYLEPSGATPPVPAPNGFIVTADELTTADPRECRPVLSYFSHPTHGGPWGKVWLYADGRLITAHGLYDGYYQQRMTPGGVGRVLSTAAAMLPDDAGAQAGPQAPYHGTPRPGVRHNGKLVRPVDPAAFAYKLFDMTWMPDSAWQDETRRPYEPRWYSACYAAGDHPLGQARTLALFSDPVADVLRSLPVTQHETLGWTDDDGSTGRMTHHCAVVSADRVGPMVERLRAAGLQIEERPAPWWYSIDLPGEQRVSIDFSLVMPNGEPGVLGG